MDKKQIEDMLAKSYTVTLRGAVLGYILALLQDEQFNLYEMMEDDITDMKAVMGSLANETVGNEFMSQIHSAAGSAFLAFALSVDEKVIEKIMDPNVSKEEVIAEAKKSRGARRDLN